MGLASMAAGALSPGMRLPPPPPAHQLTILVSHASSAMVPIAYITTMMVEQVKRKVYPYSIVPGGAADVREAKVAMTDPSVKAIYADVDLAHLKRVTLTENLSGYVSYRWGDHIYWTKKALTLKAGETIFTDGTHIVRGRCLNCYSKRPMLPIRPTEPKEALLDTPVEMPVNVYTFPKLPVMAPEIPIPPGELTPAVPVLAPIVGTVAKGGGFWFPLIPIIPPIHHHPSSPPSTPGSPGGPPVTPPVTPPVVVPEPQYGWLLIAGFLAMGITHRLRRRESL
jgi:hypothetical protein